MRLATVLIERETAKTVALLVQQAYEDVHDWHLKIGYKGGFVYGELVMDSGQPHGDIIIFVSETHLYLTNVDDFDVMMASPDVHSWMTVHHDGIYIIPQPVTREWAESFVKEHHGTA